MRWYVDNGRCKGLIASKHLLRDGHNQSKPTTTTITTSAAAAAAAGGNFPHSVATSTNGAILRASSSASTTQRVTPVRPTSLISNGISASLGSTASANKPNQTGVLLPTTTTTTNATLAQSNSIVTSSAVNATSAINTSATATSASAAAAASSTNAKSIANGNALYGNIESILGFGESACRPSEGSMSLQRPNERGGRNISSVNGEGVKVCRS